MTDRELKNLSRQDLLELLVRQEQLKQVLEARVANLEAQLEDRIVRMGQVGSMAEAAMSLNHVWEQADQAAAQYLENVRQLQERQQREYQQVIAEAETKAKAILEEAEQEKQQKMKEAEACWTELSGKLETFYRDHEGMRELLLKQSQRRNAGTR